MSYGLELGFRHDGENADQNRTDALWPFWPVFLVMWSPSALSAEGGYSNYLPGTYGDFAVAVAPEPGLFVRNDLYHYKADQSRAVLQGRARVNLDVSFTMDLITAFYATDIDIFGGKYAWGALVPIVRTDIEAQASAGIGAVRIEDDATGLGDITLIPWSLFWNFGNVHVNFAEYIITPTANYDKDNLANTGLNYWSFDTNVALTYLDPERGREFSFDVGFIYNTENPDTDYQTGTEFHLDYMLNLYFSETFAIGIHGFYLKQISGDSGDGAVLGDFKAEAAGIGPALLWVPKIFGKDVNVIVKWLHEFHAENRLKGDHIFVSFAQSRWGCELVRVRRVLCVRRPIVAHLPSMEARGGNRLRRRHAQTQQLRRCGSTAGGDRRRGGWFWRPRHGR